MFKDGELHGFCRKIDENGDYWIGQYKNGKQEGAWTQFSPDGEEIMEFTYDENGEITYD